jgi:hypothetical protein
MRSACEKARPQHNLNQCEEPPHANSERFLFSFVCIFQTVKKMASLKDAINVELSKFSKKSDEILDELFNTIKVFTFV